MFWKVSHSALSPPVWPGHPSFGNLTTTRSAASFIISSFRIPGSVAQTRVLIEWIVHDLSTSSPSSSVSKSASSPCCSQLKASAFPWSLVFWYSIIWSYWPACAPILSVSWQLLSEFLWLVYWLVTKITFWSYKKHDGISVMQRWWTDLLSGSDCISSVLESVFVLHIGNGSSAVLSRWKSITTIPCSEVSVAIPAV